MTTHRRFQVILHRLFHGFTACWHWGGREPGERYDVYVPSLWSVRMERCCKCGMMRRFTVPINGW